MCSTEENCRGSSGGSLHASFDSILLLLVKEFSTVQLGIEPTTKTFPLVSTSFFVSFDVRKVEFLALSDITVALVDL